MNDLINLMPGGTAFVTAKVWGEYLNKNGDLFIRHGYFYRLKGTDVAGGIVRAELVREK